MCSLMSCHWHFSWSSRPALSLYPWILGPSLVQAESCAHILLALLSCNSDVSLLLECPYGRCNFANDLETLRGVTSAAALSRPPFASGLAQACVRALSPSNVAKEGDVQMHDRPGQQATRSASAFSFLWAPDCRGLTTGNLTCPDNQPLDGSPACPFLYLRMQLIPGSASMIAPSWAQAV